MLHLNNNGQFIIEIRCPNRMTCANEIDILKSAMQKYKQYNTTIVLKLKPHFKSSFRLSSLLLKTERYINIYTLYLYLVVYNRQQNQ